jgi:glutaredoxin-related protein
MSIEQFIDSEVKSNDVVLFMKGTPQFPQCGFSGQVVQILDHIGVGYKGLNVLESADVRCVGAVSDDELRKPGTRLRAPRSHHR